MSISTNTVMSAELAQWLQVFMAGSNARIQEVEAQKDELEVRSGIYTDLRTKLMSLRKLAREFTSTGNLSPLAAKIAKGGDDNILGVSATANPMPGGHTVRVRQLAHAHSMVSNQVTSAGTEIADTWDGDLTFTIRRGETDYVVNLTVTAGTSNRQVLDQVTAAINAATGDAVQASAVSDTRTTARMSLTSGATGTENALTVTDPSGFLAALGLTAGTAATATAGGYVYADLGNGELDAKLVVDGIAIERASNTVTDVIPGVTLTLRRQQLESDADVSFTLAVDKDSIRKKLDEFLTLYNETYAYLKSKVDVDASTKERGALAGNYSYMSLWQRMRVALAGPVGEAGTAHGSLASIGITSNQVGSFSVSDAEDFENALEADLDGIIDLFSAEDGIATRLDELLKTYVEGGGIISNSTESVRNERKFLDAKQARLEKMQEMERDQLISQYGALLEAQNMQSSLLTMLSNLSSYLGL